MTNYLQQWNSAVLWRRAGLLAARLELADLHTACAEQLATMTDIQRSIAPLFVGGPTVGLDCVWNLTTPWATSEASGG